MGTGSSSIRSKRNDQPTLSERFCQPCKEGQKDVKARTLCYECLILLCEPCSDYHQRLKSTKDHHLVDLVHLIKNSASRNEPSTTKSSTFNKDELASDFLENISLREDTVLYHGAQVAVESTSVTPKSEERTTPNQADPSLKATKCLEFSAKRPEDNWAVNVKGVLCLSDKVVVLDYGNKVLKLFYKNGTFLSYVELDDNAFGITSVRGSTFATCGLGNTVRLWTVRGQAIVSDDVSYHVAHDADGIHYNGKYYCVIHNTYNAITILDRPGRQIRKIIKKEAFGKKLAFGNNIYMESDTNNIYVSCIHEHGILCMTVEGQSLWLTPLPGLQDIIEIRGTLCVSDSFNDCIHMISKEAKNIRKLVEKKDLGGEPRCICYGQDGRLYVSYYTKSKRRYMISVYTIT